MLLHKIIVLMSDIEHIFSPAYKHPRRGKILRNYLRIRVRASLNRWFHFTHEHFLDYRVEVPDYDVFLAIFRQIFVRHTYYLETKNSSPKIIDCGGNIGMSVLYFKYLYPNASITVFEPSREVLSVMKRNIEGNKLKDVKIVEAAVSAKDGELEIHPRGNAASGNTLLSGISEATPKKGLAEKPYTVKTVRLSPHIPETLDLLKLDIEGSEGGVIQELEDAGKLHSVKEYVMEYHYYPQVPENNFGDLVKCFERNGLGVQMYFEDMPAASEQLSFAHNGSYAISLRTSPLKK